MHYARRSQSEKLRTPFYKPAPPRHEFQLVHSPRFLQLGTPGQNSM
jgi:hypothetical protein